MAEGLPITPDEDKESNAPRAKATEVAKHRFWQELFKDKSDKKDSKESEEDEDDDEETGKKKSRFSRMWSSLFPKVAQKETVKDSVEAPQPRGLFFEQTNVEADDSSAEQSGELPDAGLTQAEVSAIETPSEVATESPVEHTTEEVPERPKVEAPVERPVAAVVESPAVETPEPAPRPRTDVYDRVPDEVATLAPERSSTTTERSAAPERVVVGGLSNAERLRLARMERRQKDIERTAKQVKKEVTREQQPQKTVERPPVVVPTERVVYQHSPERPVPSPKTPEKAPQPQQVERIVKQETIETKPEHEQKRVVEELLKTEIKETTDDTKEIQYELSHEHKDLDKQSAAAWTALQASADAQAKANAAAIAAAQAASQAGISAQDAQKIAQQAHADLYKKAALSGFVTAVVIIAVIIAMILLK